MNNPVLNSESFERASYALGKAMDRFANDSQFTYDVRAFALAVDNFRSSVDELRTILETLSIPVKEVE
jgi:hypothetical protein